MKQGFGHYLKEVARHLDPRPLPSSGLAWVNRHLNPAERALFFAMRPSDQRHALAVALAVAQERDLCLKERWVLTRAALLHDVGKDRGRSGLAVRTANVLWRGGLPRWLPVAFREAVEELRAHPVRGAQRLRAAGTELAVVLLVRWHEAEVPVAELPDALQPLLLLLQRADAVC